MKHQKTILVVDDNGSNRLVPGLILRPFGFTVLESSSGQEAIDMLLHVEVSGVLLDIQMPGLSGLEVLRRIRSELERNGVIESVACQDDGRAKYLMPTEKFYEAIYLHAQEAKKIFQKNFLMIEK